MPRRLLYVVMFAIPALLGAVIVAAVVTATAAGAFWIFVFGDDPWPLLAERTLGGLFFAVTAGLCVGALWAAYAVGRREETNATLNRAHVTLALGSTVALALFIGWRTLGFRLGPQSDSEQCIDLCLAAGFSGSGLPPRDSGDRTCSCYDDDGREALRTPLPPR